MTRLLRMATPREVRRYSMHMHFHLGMCPSYNHRHQHHRPRHRQVLQAARSPKTKRGHSEFRVRCRLSGTCSSLPSRPRFHPRLRLIQRCWHVVDVPLPQRPRSSKQTRQGCRGVKRLSEELAEPLSIIVSGMCPLCKVPRAECFRPGDWGCPVCGQHNYPDKLVCSNYRCQTMKGVAVLCAPGPPAPPAPPPAPSSWCDSCRRPRSECWKPNDWECPWCKNHNYARKQVPRLSQQSVVQGCSDGAPAR